MKIEFDWISKKGKNKRSGYYEETDDFSHLPPEKIKSVCAFCYYDNKFVIVKNGSYWEPVAGHIEVGETPEQALIREIKEESNMKVLKYFPIGYLYTREVDIYQTRYLCFVEPYGPFEMDPDGGVTEIKLVPPAGIVDVINWKDSALLMKDKCMEIIRNSTAL
jgi:8-oxo-dGTP pyrophosphatase MutT (NUDIX family)